ncbi:sulfatase family protein [Alienimonas californiensis]|uniref:Arylsulfatase n=1 Tax=Alienimonas californiensis TaxID=2527989 RepID=A0A517P6M3_9PLAN|nr:sulfatase [Alienimonas californiensis]QDT15002.1 Arylsulfatase [Alienimonas californiensis]
MRLLALLLCLGVLQTSTAAAADRAAGAPNVVIIFIDDQGYGDLSCYGSEIAETPRIDSLAAEGMKFTSFYSAYCVCSASRAALLTGCYPPRLSMPGVLGPNSRVGLHPDEVTIADLLKERGYATMCVGKWHVGDRLETLPTAQGFDRYFGLPYSNDMARQKGWGNDSPDLDKIWRQKKWDIYHNDLYRNGESAESPVDQTTLTQRYTEEAVGFIRENKDRPFLLYMPHTMVHVPLFVTDDRWEEDPAKAYRLAVEHVDWSVGEVLDTLEELKLAENTLVIYTSDNGPWLSKRHHAGSAGPLRNGKGTTWEGGMRVPGLFRWPGVIPAGTVTDRVAGTVDLLPTLAEAAGAELPDRPIDGHSLLGLLKDPQAPSPHDEHGLFYYKNGRVEGLRMGRWKLRFGDKNASTVSLYDLDADIGKSHDVAAANPAVLGRLIAIAERYDRDLKANQRPIWTAGK